MTLIIPDAAPRFLAGRRASGSLAAGRQGVQHAFAVISYKGKSWRLKYRGEDTLLRGSDNRPLQALDVVIVGVSPAISKIYYEKSYVEGNEDGPDCFSLDGEKPDAAAPRKQNGICATCPHNQWGSRVTDSGKRAKQCQDNRRLAIVPSSDILNEACGGPMLLRLPPTTLTNFATYSDMLERKGCGEIWWVQTRLSFDAELAYPRIVFEPVAYVDEDQDRLITEVRRSPQLERILVGTATPVTDVEPEEPQPLAIPGTPPRRPAPAAQQVAPPEPPPEENEEEQAPEEEGEEEQAPPPASPPPAAAISPFQRSTRGRPPGKTNGAAPNGAGGSAAPGGAKAAVTKIAPTAPAPASDELEDAIGDLLDQPA